MHAEDDGCDRGRLGEWTRRCLRWALRDISGGASCLLHVCVVHYSLVPMPCASAAPQRTAGRTRAAPL